jgi:hypothetical protein
LEPFEAIMDRLRTLVDDMIALEDGIRKMMTPIFAYPVRCIISAERLRVFREDVQKVIPKL